MEYPKVNTVKATPKIVSRILYNLHKIKDSIDKDPHVGISGTGLRADIARELQNKKIVVNYGSKQKPVYSWNESVAVTEELAKELDKTIKDFRREHYPYLFSSSTTKQEAKEEPKEIIIPEEKTYITDFTDDELWKELKRRGWSGTIEKTTITYMS